MTKIPKLTEFSQFKAIFVKFARDFLDQNVESIQQRMNTLSSRKARGDKCSFERKLPQ